jgi:chloride channel protein, CIC family
MLEAASKMDNFAPSNRPISHPQLWLLAAAVGIIAGVGAVIFSGLIGVLHNLLFLGKFSFTYDARARNVRPSH